MVNALPPLHNLRSVPIGAPLSDSFKLHLGVAKYHEGEVPELKFTTDLKKGAYLLMLQVADVKDPTTRLNIAQETYKMFTAVMEGKGVSLGNQYFSRERSCSRVYETHYYWFTRGYDEEEAFAKMLGGEENALQTLATEVLGKSTATVDIGGSPYKYEQLPTTGTTIDLEGTLVGSYVSLQFQLAQPGA